MNTKQLSTANPEAFKALPEPYQNDDVLEFWVIDGELYCRPKEDQKFALGDWDAIYDSNSKIWDDGSL